MNVSRRVPPVLAAVVAAGALGACAVPTSYPPPVPETTSATASKPTPGDGTVQRSDADLQGALLGLADLPKGFSVLSEATSNDYATFSSTDPKCRAFVRMSNELVAPGTLASANVTLAAKAGTSQAVFTEWLDSFGSSAKVAGQLRPFKAAIAPCAKVSMTVPGAGSGTATIAVLKPPKVGTSPLAWRITFSSGPLKGVASTSITTGVGDTSLHLQFIGVMDADMQRITQMAVTKAKSSLAIAETEVS